MGLLRIRRRLFGHDLLGSILLQRQSASLFLQRMRRRYSVTRAKSQIRDLVGQQIQIPMLPLDLSMASGHDSTSQFDLQGMARNTKYGVSRCISNTRDFASPSTASEASVAQPAAGR
jgi:hypothetical protein